MKCTIDIKDLYFDYGSGDVLKGVSVDIDEGQLYALFGPNGSGKTTLLKCIAGFLKYKMGHIMVMGKEIEKLGSRELSKYISYVPQEHRLSFPFTVEEVVLMGRTPYLGDFSGPKNMDMEYTNEAMRTVGIQNIANRFYTQLSGGQRQLVHIARAIAQDTPIMILDEPTSALDFKNQMKVWKILKSLVKHNKTVIACTHDPNHVSWFCDSVVVLNGGHIVNNGPTKKVMTGNVLNSLYDNTCCLGFCSGMKMVLPNINN